MANATETENCFFDQSCDHGLDVDEFSNIDSSLLMSLLEDSQVEDGDEELLRRMIESLEPEIMNQDSCSETYSSDGSPPDHRLSDVDQLESSCSSTSPDYHLDFEWIDMGMAYSSPSDDITSYFIGHFTEEIETMVEGLEDYSQLVCDGMAMEEEDDYNIGLWQ